MTRKEYSPEVKEKLKGLKDSPIRYHDKVIGYITVVQIKDCSIDVTVVLTNCYKCGMKLGNAAGIGQFCPNRKCDVADGVGRFNMNEIH
jgi:hypothetical protein